jgi:hypothetical protein
MRAILCAAAVIPASAPSLPFMRRKYSPIWGLAVVQRISCLTEKLSGPVLDLPHARPEYSASTFVVVRT